MRTYTVSQKVAQRAILITWRGTSLQEFTSFVFWPNIWPIVKLSYITE